MPDQRQERTPRRGHDLPRPLWPEFADAIDELTAAGW
ncbi:hypothetical protein FHR32_001045 [Streptosporangium album]|uniref:Uncharacterized protein n=1 Tax=Streptosporangium album TaxID=47479 RepID=A0A7W7RR90_9ACTN|nr:hypothetical protein [Streptosporangium album]